MNSYELTYAVNRFISPDPKRGDSENNTSNSTPLRTMTCYYHRNHITLVLIL